MCPRRTLLSECGMCVAPKVGGLEGAHDKHNHNSRNNCSRQTVTKHNSSYFKHDLTNLNHAEARGVFADQFCSRCCAQVNPSLKPVLAADLADRLSLLAAKFF